MCISRATAATNIQACKLQPQISHHMPLLSNAPCICASHAYANRLNCGYVLFSRAFDGGTLTFLSAIQWKHTCSNHGADIITPLFCHFVLVCIHIIYSYNYNYIHNKLISNCYKSPLQSQVYHSRQKIPYREREEERNNPSSKLLTSEERKEEVTTANCQTPNYNGR